MKSSRWGLSRSTRRLTEYRQPQARKSPCSVTKTRPVLVWSNVLPGARLHLKACRFAPIAAEPPQRAASARDAMVATSAGCSRPMRIPRDHLGRAIRSQAARTTRKRLLSFRELRRIRTLFRACAFCYSCPKAQQRGEAHDAALQEI